MTATLTRPAPIDVAARPPRVRRSSVLCWALTAVGVTMLALSLNSIPSAPLSQFGLLATASPLFGGSILVATVAFVLAVRARMFSAAVTATLVVLLAQRLPDSVSTAVPLYSWTYKHLGVVDYIHQHGTLAHGLDVYQGWPGLFAVTAWFCDITGSSPDTVAHWFTPCFHLAMLGLMYVLARVWGLDKWVALVATFLVESLNWVNQDYFSPQAVGLLLAVGFLIAIAGRDVTPRVAALSLVVFAALVVTHQLTPYWLMAACLALTITRRLRPRWLIVAMIVLAGAFLAFNWNTVSHFSLLSFNPVGNAKSNVATVGVLGQRLTSKMVRTLGVLVWGSAALCGLRGWRRHETVLPQTILAFSSFGILGGQGYGGEAIFRVFLYSLPGCALLVAPTLTSLLRAGWAKVTLTSIVLVGCIAASAQGTFGGWFANRISRAQVDASRDLLNTAEFPAYLTVAAPVWPERSTARYADYLTLSENGEDYDYPMIYAAKLVGADFSTDAQYRTFDQTMAARTNGPTYLIITRQTTIYDWYFGILPLNSLENLQVRMRSDPRWSVYRDTAQYVIFKSTPALNGVK